MRDAGRRIGTPSIDILKGCFNKKKTTCFILGSGTSLTKALFYLKRRKVPRDRSFFISVNERPLKIVEDADMIVSVDKYMGGKIWRRYRIQQELRKHNPMILSIWDRFSDLVIEEHVWLDGFSSMTACYIACYMGFDKVVLLGMDCYQGKKIYFDKERDKASRNRELDVHLKLWARVKDYCPDAEEKIRAYMNPLEEVFGDWRWYKVKSNIR